MANNSLEVFRTSIKLGSIEIDAYTAHQKDEHGRWINYLSGAGMATSVKLHRNTTLQNRMSEELKALLGKDFTTLQGKYCNSQNSFSKVELWTTTSAPKYWRYHDRNLLKISACESDFWRHMSNHFGNAIQLEIDL
jgi:hypothetical protein